MLEPDKERVFLMNERRKEMLENILKELNPKAFEATCQELIAELSDIYQTLFDIKYEIIRLSKTKPKK